MSCYISSQNNRFYVAREEEYGKVAAITSRNRLSAVKLSARQQLESIQRRDKTGSRTFAGLPDNLRRQTQFDLRTYLTEWDDASQAPRTAPLLEAAFGGTATLFGGAPITSCSGRTLQFGGATQLDVGHAVGIRGELRFVTALLGPNTVQINAPFTSEPPPGAALGNSVSFRLDDDLPSVSVFDYWSPATAVQRVLNGAAVNQMVVKINSDLHEFEFSGVADDLLDGASFSDGQGQLTSFPPEPELEPLRSMPVPGHLGQVWIGDPPNRFYTLTSGKLELDNGIELRNREFGTNSRSCIAAGERTVKLSFSLYSSDTQATIDLYQAARQRTPVPVMVQLGQKPGQLFGFYLSAVTLEVPEYNDDDARLQWSFVNCRAQGALNDEVFAAFG